MPLGRLLRRVRSAVASFFGPETYEYECMNCGEAFAETTRNMNDVECPDCGKGRKHVRDKV
jgi:DNA-directed RNA polymerase subunit RPC12/RpoP